jgi:hypothetical protein
MIDCVNLIWRYYSDIIFRFLNVRQGASVSIVSDYRQGNWGSIPGMGKGFFF